MVPLKNIQYSGLLDFLLTELWAFSLRKNDICIGIWIEIQMDFECWLHKALLNVSWGKKIKKSDILVFLFTKTLLGDIEWQMLLYLYAFFM